MNELTVIKCQIGMFAGIDYQILHSKIFDGGYVNKDTIPLVIILTDPIFVEIITVPMEGRIQGQVQMIPQWLGYRIHASTFRLTLEGSHLLFSLPMESDNMIVNLYKRTMAQPNPFQKKGILQ